MMPLRQVLTPHGGIAMYDREASHALTDQLLAEASDGLDHIAGELANLYRHWLEVGVDARSVDWLRSEEHTSELQSLMRTSYAVFCLKKKKNKKKQNNLSSDK